MTKVRVYKQGTKRKIVKQLNETYEKYKQIETYKKLQFIRNSEKTHRKTANSLICKFHNFHTFTNSHISRRNTNFAFIIFIKQLCR